MKMNKTAQAFQGTVPREAFPDSNSNGESNSNSNGESKFIDPFPESPKMKSFVDRISQKAPKTIEEKLEEIERAVEAQEARKSTVAHPEHYTSGRFETIAVIEDWNLGFHLGNAVKYLSRAEHKGEKRQDLRKAAWYILRELWKDSDKRGELERAMAILEEV
jgi:Protein of unknwon function (DUF3310)